MFRKKIRFYCFRAAFDYESYFCKQNLPPNGPQLKWVSEHIPISVSVGSSVPGFLETKCFVSNGNVQELVFYKTQYLEEISGAAYRILQEQFRYVFVTLERLRDTRLAAEPNSSKEKHPLTRLMNRFDSFLSVFPVLGLNSGRYDLNVAKRFILQSLRDKIEFVVKRNNNSYICVKTPLLKFLDIVNYVAPGFSYDKFVRAYDVSQTKFFFPYEWLDDLSKLNETCLPPYEAFFSSVKNCNITLEEYDLCKKVWLNKKMKTFKDFLVYYNNLDVASFLKAIEKCFNFYKTRCLDMFKDGLTVPGLTLKYLFSTVDKNVTFNLFNKKTKTCSD